MFTQEQIDKIKKLRELTDSTLLECRDALMKTEFDLDKAKQYLRGKYKPIGLLINERHI